VIAGIELFLRRLRDRVSRTTWAIRNFGLSSRQASRNAPGLVMIQIDGLSEDAFQRALKHGRLPFMKSLLEKEEYKQLSLYSGLPSSTPAIQAELFYGVKQAVPAFCYYDGVAGRIVSMFEGADAREIRDRLESKGEPLLKDGSAYADMFSGGASEAHFCMTQYGWPDVIREGPPIKLALLMLLHLASVARIVVLAGVELVLAVFDVFRGLIEKKDLWMELKFVPSRLAVCIVMREVIVVRSAMDLARGLPIVHMNFLGYDEQAHRRGPDSAFARWTLKGIDAAVKRVCHAATRSLARDYDVWIYSDHGQIKSVPYRRYTGEAVQTAIARIFDQTVSTAYEAPSGIQFQRARMLRPKRHRPETQPPARLPIVTALGPLGCVYLGTTCPADKRNAMARALVEQARIPIVFAGDGVGHATAWTEKGRYSLPEDAAAVLGPEHPFLREVAADMVALTHHEHSGDFFISGFRPDGVSLSFPSENGSHGGISGAETTAFALLPNDAPLPEKEEGSLRAGSLRVAALTLLRRHTPLAPRVAARPSTTRAAVRVLTYNVHNCAGMDGRVSPHRIARVIQREHPDIVALQEVDVGRLRSGGQDQAVEIARHLEMFHHFHAAIELEEEQYGDAILSRLPMRLVRAGLLPYRRAWLVNEPRGALWVSVDIGAGHRVQVLNTHFGLWRRERRLQAEALLGGEWLGHPACTAPVVLCGDLNSGPQSAAYRCLGKCLRDVQTTGKRTPRGTFSGRFPLHRIDHVFASEHVEVLDIRVPRTHLALTASDHLPLVVDLSLT
jgi:endonuclease/exonuclease/phosphatase family metal-dependent hydrolase